VKFAQHSGWTTRILEAGNGDQFALLLHGQSGTNAGAMVPVMSRLAATHNRCIRAGHPGLRQGRPRPPKSFDYSLSDAQIAFVDEAGFGVSGAVTGGAWLLIVHDVRRYDGASRGPARARERLSRAS